MTQQHTTVEDKKHTRGEETRGTVNGDAAAARERKLKNKNKNKEEKRRAEEESIGGPAAHNTTRASVTDILM